MAHTLAECGEGHCGFGMGCSLVLHSKASCTDIRMRECDSGDSRSPTRFCSRAGLPGSRPWIERLSLLLPPFPEASEGNVFLRMHQVDCLHCELRKTVGSANRSPKGFGVADVHALASATDHVASHGRGHSRRRATATMHHVHRSRPSHYSTRRARRTQDRMARYCADAACDEWRSNRLHHRAAFLE